MPADDEPQERPAAEHAPRQPQRRRFPTSKGVARGWRVIDFWILGALALFLLVLLLGIAALEGSNLERKGMNLLRIGEWDTIHEVNDQIEELEAKIQDQEPTEEQAARLGQLQASRDSLRNSMREWALIIAWVILAGLFGATMRLRHCARVRISFFTQWQERIVWSLSGFLWGWIDFPFYLILLILQRQKALPNVVLSLGHILFIILPLPLWMLHDVLSPLFARLLDAIRSKDQEPAAQGDRGRKRGTFIIPSWHRNELKQVDETQLRHFLVSHQNAVKFVFLAVVSLTCAAVSLAAPSLADPLSVIYFWLFLLFCAIVGFDLESYKVFIVVLLLIVLFLAFHSFNLLPQAGAFLGALTARGSPAIYTTIAGAALFLTLLDYFRAELYPYWVEGDIMGHVIRFTGASRTGTLFRAGVEAEHPDFIEFLMYRQGVLHIRGVNLEEAGEDRTITIENVPDITFHSQHIATVLKKLLHTDS